MQDACGRRPARQTLTFINIVFAMYSGALLATSARLAWDPSTFLWFRFFLETQYRVSAMYVLVVGLWLAALVCLATLCAHRLTFYLYASSMAFLMVSELVYGVWMLSSVVLWWNNEFKGKLARSSIEVLLLGEDAVNFLDNYLHFLHPIKQIFEEVKVAIPVNVALVGVFCALGVGLQIAAVLLSVRLAREARGARGARREPDSERGAARAWPKLNLFTISKGF